MFRRFGILIVASVLMLSSLPSSSAAELTGQDKEFAYVLYNAWKELDAYSNSQGPLKVTVHAGSDIKKVHADEIKKGVQLVLDKYSGFLNPTDQFHIIIASNYKDAELLIGEVNNAMPEYIHYNERHLNQARERFEKSGEISASGSTSSRGCVFQGGPYGRFGETQLIPCPKLPGGVVYFFANGSWMFKYFDNLRSTGGHEAFHGILSYLNPGSHWNTSEWIIEGTMQTVGLSAVTNSKNLKTYGTLTNPSPSDIKVGGYDLRFLDNNPLSQDRFTVGVLAVSLLINDYGAAKYFKFLLEMGFPKKGEEQLYDYFGITKEDFYKRFYDYSEWYYKGGVEKIKYLDFETGAYNPPGSSTKASKKISYSCISKNGKDIKGIYERYKVKCPKGYKKL